MMTLAQVAWKLGELAREGAVRYDAHDIAVMCSQMADAVTAHLSQPPPVAQGQAVDDNDSPRGNPLYELIRKSVAQGRVYGTQYDMYQWRAVIDQITDRLYKDYRVSSPINREEWDRAFADGRAFRDTNPEGRYVEDSELLNCPTCAGSGHVDDATARIHATPTTPTGYRLVPVEPTPEMLERAREVHAPLDGEDDDFDYEFTRTWKAMIAASPSAGGV